MEFPNKLASRLKEPSQNSASKKDFVPELQHLDSKQVEWINRFIDKQVKEGWGFGIPFDEDLIQKEKTFFLVSIDVFGGIKGVKEKEFDELKGVISKEMYRFFSRETESFFEKFSKIKQSGSNLRYNLHLDLALAGLLNSIYNSDLKE